jgi:hypothetical protein
VIVIVPLLSIELGSYLAVRELHRLGVVYRPGRVNYADYMLNRDPTLGWPTRAFHHRYLDAIGARKEPAFPDPSTEAFMSLYGDSFIFASEVDDEAAWPNVLARMIGRRINNFGIGGYSSSQAYLRFQGNRRDSAGIVVLGFLSENIKRNVNQFRTLLNPAMGPHAFSPGFALNATGELELVPLPTFTEEEFPKVLAHPERYLSHEVFAPGGMAGVQAFEFPFTWTLSKALLRNYSIASGLRGEPGGYTAFYQPEHPSRAFEITVKIMERFVAQARGEGRIPYVLVIPKGTDLAYHQKNGRWVYQRLLDTLEARKLPFWHVGEDLLTRIGSRDIREFYTDHNLGAHPNAQGNRMMAEIIRDRSRESSNGAQ